MEIPMQAVRAFPIHSFQPLLRASFVAGPLLLALSAMAFRLGIGLIPPGVTSWVEGLIGSYALALFVPVYLELSRRLAVTHRRLAMVTVVTGLFGATAGFSMEFLRLVEHSLRARGAGDVVWQAFAADPGGPLLAVALLGPLFPLTSILLGAGFFRARTLPRWVSLCLITAGIGFPLAQVGGFPWALAWAYPAACGLWLISLGWVALSSD
ncbi:MAG: hypothetical protein AB7H81_08355 [Vicinamibacterales bacterium]